jgi:hypothetical protein
MGKKPISTPNTHLGEVIWHRDMHFGRLLYVCQGLLGLDPTDKHDYKFINSKKHSIGDLWDFFQEVELENGKLGLHLFTGAMGSLLATIETTFKYGEPVPDQLFLNIIADFIEYVGTLPLEGPGEDPYTDEEMEEACQVEAEILGPVYQALADVGFKQTEIPADDGDNIPF